MKRRIPLWLWAAAGAIGVLYIKNRRAEGRAKARVVVNAIAAEGGRQAQGNYFSFG